MREGLLIFACFSVKMPKAKPSRSKYKSSMPQLEAMEKKGNLLIRDLWQNGTDSVHEMRTVNTDAKYHLEKTPEKFLQEAERAKGNIYF